MHLIKGFIAKILSFYLPFILNKIVSDAFSTEA